MAIVRDDRDGCVVLTLTGELNALSSHALRAAVGEALEAGGTRFVVDLAGVPFIDSSGLGALVAGLKQAKLAGGTMVLAGLREQARVIFEITMAYRLFDIVGSADAATELLVV